MRNNSYLAAQYDQHAQERYVPFNKSLQQIPCNTTSSAQYSLARNCTDCARDYKRWLCSVTIPRCDDFANNNPLLIPRGVPNTSSSQIQDPIQAALNSQYGVFNGSRDSQIDQLFNPGQYKEILPCEQLCFQLVQSCPAALQFSCPQNGWGKNYTYGKPPGENGMCNSLLWPQPNRAERLLISRCVPYIIMAMAFLSLVT